jgi:hypothetical protein
MTGGTEERQYVRVRVTSKDGYQIMVTKDGEWEPTCEAAAEQLFVMDAKGALEIHAAWKARQP